LAGGGAPKSLQMLAPCGHIFLIIAKPPLKSLISNAG
jgi:hypothetical protein